MGVDEEMENGMGHGGSFGSHSAVRLSTTVGAKGASVTHSILHFLVYSHPGRGGNRLKPSEEETEQEEDMQVPRSQELPQSSVEEDKENYDVYLAAWEKSVVWRRDWM
jgi:hypothetical protein